MATTYTLSSAMSLPIPVPGSAPGPDWAELLNACLGLLDGHTHTPGSGNPITPDAISINANLTFNSNNAVSLRSARFTPQSTPLALPTDVGCLYESGVDLYYNDGSGNQVRLTQSGGVAGSPGSISNLTSPASAAYQAGSQTFVWQSGANLPANLDGGALVLRNLTVGSNGITLTAPNALGANYVLTLPAAPPLTTKLVTMDSTGALGVTYDVDNFSLEIASATLRLKDLGITTPKLADGAVTKVKMGAFGQQLSASSGSFSSHSTSYVDVTNLTCTITTSGRPVTAMLVSDGSASSGIIVPSINDVKYLSLVRGGGFLGAVQFGGYMAGPGGVAFLRYPPSSVQFFDAPSAGTYTYKIQFQDAVGGGTDSIVANCKLLVFEMG